MTDPVAGQPGTVFYCYEAGDKGWYKVTDDNKHAVKISATEAAQRLGGDIQDPPRLSNYQEYTKVPVGGAPGGHPSADGTADPDSPEKIDLLYLAKGMESKGLSASLTTEQYLHIAQWGSIEIDGVTYKDFDEKQRNTANYLATHPEEFNRIDRAGGVPEGNVAWWDIEAALDVSRSGNT